MIIYKLFKENKDGTYMKCAIISNPRTGSRTLANRLSHQTGNPIGYLHFAESVESSCLTYEELISQDWTLHGHWHTLHNLSDQHTQHIKQNYTVYEIVRDPLHRFASSIIAMATGDIDFQFKDIPVEIDCNLVYKYFERLASESNNRLDWNVDICYNFDKIYNNTSLSNFKKNSSAIKNYQSLELLYRKITKEVKC